MTNKKLKLEDILNGLGVPNDPSPQPDPEEVLQFKTNPLASIMLHTELHSTINERNYSGVFENDDEYLGYNSDLLKNDLCAEPEFAEICGLATEIIIYFRELLTMKRLKGTVFTPFEENLSEFLKLTENNQCKIKHLQLAVKLPEFHQVEQYFLEMSEQLDSIEENSEDIVQMQTKLTPLHVWAKHTKKEKKERTFLHFKSEKNKLVEYQVQKSNIILELFNSLAFRNIELDVQIYGTLKTHPLSGFTYVVADQIDING